MTGLVDLPPELLKHVVSFAAESDLKLLRLVCRVFEAMATPPLFAHLTVWLQTACLHRLVAVAEHSRIRHYVQTLTIGNECLDTEPPSPGRFVSDFLNRQLALADRVKMRVTFGKLWGGSWTILPHDFREMTADTFLAHDVLEDLTVVGWDHERLFNAYKACGTILIEQHTLIQQSLDVSYLARVFSGLLNLRTVDITTTIEIDRLQLNKTIRSFRNIPSGLLRQGKRRSWGVSSIVKTVIAVRPRQDGRHLNVFLRAATPSLRITKLLIDDSIWGEQGLELGGYNLGKLSPETIRSAAPALQQIRTLTLPLGQYGREEEVKEQIEHRAAQFLSVLPSLEHLTVQMCPDYQVEVVDILKDMSTQSLRSINLDNCIYRASSFKNFLKEHSRTLKEMVLNDTSLFDCRFQEIFQFMRENMSLDKLVLNGGLWELEDGSESEDDQDSDASGVSPVLGADEIEAKRSIVNYVTRKSDWYPSRLFRE